MVEAIRKIFKVFADNNLFEEGVELIGSWCFKLYQNYLGVKKFPLSSLDVDFLIPVPFHGKEHLGFIKQLEDLYNKGDVSVFCENRNVPNYTNISKQCGKIETSPLYF